ncbi:MAG: hypothetical protein M1831_004433 [Alyxoria varia]|nr:MAG: hypothetical protein M1831_004433 [Alyxoria varia]
MAEGEEGWRKQEIVYVTIVGAAMLAALFEWLLWLLAFLYCLVKVYQKAEELATQILAVVMMVIFTLLRAMFLPVILAVLPLPSHITSHFPHGAVTFFQWFAFWTFAWLLTVPWLLCIYQLVVHSFGRTKLVKEMLDEFTAPKLVVVMPCYKEVPGVLLRTVDSIVDSDYPSACLHVFLSFDGEQEDDLYLNTIEKLGVPVVRRFGFPVSIDVVYKGTRITVSRFPHGGKRQCQKRTFKLIHKIYTEYLKANDNLFVLFIDSDCILESACIQNFMYEMELNPGNEHTMLAMTGVLTATTEKHSFISLLQDMEYIHGQLFERAVESGCGAVTCLPGALTVVRFSAFRKLSNYYFSEKAEQCADLFDYGKCHLGEDRWLTHLFMIAAERRYQIGISTGAYCKTEAVQTYKALLKQRRRWFLGFITNEVCMLTDWRLWRRYPFLGLIRMTHNTIKTTALLFFVMVISLMTTSQTIENLPVGFIAVSLGLNWLLMAVFAGVLGRYKILLYPVLFVVGPFFNWVYMVYAIFTAGQRTWGGPRADAGKADFMTSPAAAIKRAEAGGDDLNVVPESFRPSSRPDSSHSAGGIGLGSQNSGKMHSQPVPLQPDRRWEGRFRGATRNSVWSQSHSVGSESRVEQGLGPGARGSRPPSAFHNPRIFQQSRLSTDSSSSLSGSSIGEPPVYMAPRAASSVVANEFDRPPSQYPPSASGLFLDGQSNLMCNQSDLSGSGTYQDRRPSEGSTSRYSSMDVASVDGIYDLPGLHHANNMRDMVPADSNRQIALGTHLASKPAGSLALGPCINIGGASNITSDVKKQESKMPFKIDQENLGAVRQGSGSMKNHGAKRNIKKKMKKVMDLNGKR